MYGSSETIRSSPPFVVAICGNPNSGKTTIFNALTGLSQRVGNYPGVTVERVSGTINLPTDSNRRCTVVDIPGSYSLAAISPDEYIAAGALFGSISGESKPDLIVCVIDATNLERGLYLLFQVMEIGQPMLVVLNMVDLAKKQGMQIDSEALSIKLGGIPVVTTVGSKGVGIHELKQSIANLDSHGSLTNEDGFYDPFTSERLERLVQSGNNGGRARAECVRILFDEDGPAEKIFFDGGGEKELLEQCRQEVRGRFGSLSAGETTGLMNSASKISEDAVRKVRSDNSWSQKIDRVVLHPIFGPLILAAIMTFIFQSIFSWSEPLMNLIDSFFSMLASTAGGTMTDGPLRSLVTDGIIGGVGSVIVFLPQIVVLFLFISILEDSGYLPRAAFIVDRLFGWCGLSGKSLIPMLSSFACAVPGIMATRTIEDRKLRFMTIMMLPFMSCSARLPVYTIMIAAFIPSVTYFGFFNSRGVVLSGLYLLGLFVAMTAAFIFKKTFHQHERCSFLMELPSYKRPTVRSVGLRVLNRAQSFLVRAGTVILAITIIIWAASYYPHSDTITSDFERQRISLTEQNQSGNIAAENQLEQKLLLLEREEAGALLSDSYLGRIGKTVQPVFKPLGWDWKITMATLASFPAREVIIATLGTIYNLGSDVDESSGSLIEKLQLAKWEEGPRMGEPVFTPAVAMSVMVFFALCAQCGATLVTIRQETGRLIYPIISFVSMTSMAYVGAFLVFQLFNWVRF